MAYMGSKTGAGVAQAVIAQMPPHDTYVETHLGSGAVMLAKPPAASSLGVDLDRQVVEIFRPHELPNRRAYHADAVAFLDGLFDGHTPDLGRVLIYADPPYVLATRTSTRRYRHDMDDAGHIRLLEALRAVPAAVILSGYPSALYDRLVGDWRSIEFQAMTRGGPRTEKLWMNFPAGQVQWARWAGQDFTDRQRIKRKAARWARFYAECPPGERLAILAAILATHEPPTAPAA